MTIANKLRFAFSKQNLTQASTMKAIISFMVAIGLFHFTPDEQQQLASLSLRFIAAITELLSIAHALYAFINLFHNEDKAVIVPAQPPKG